ncbi:universal stress protein [Nocardiopsis suaedae]|uniref:Universal stress protein n=1 Tax=Nocardiopsis suaedae TaxID=3018444 RepID=A0ABT4TJG8_9ACTN|nr:universal stress protein [Nocardiopsis suaedae]MDA2804817.1 universal stress protein [Nocardiopsis suaedae]
MGITSDGGGSGADPAAEAGRGDVVVGIDGSAPGQAALEWAAREAEERGTGLLILHALNMPLVSVPFGHPVRLTPTPETAERAGRLLDQASAHLRRRHPELKARTQVSSADAVHALLAAARTAAVVAVGSRGLGGLGSVFLGSVSIRVSAHAPCPVAVVPGPKEGDGAERTAGRRGRVVVGVDGSRDADAALRFALEEAARGGGEVLALHAWQISAPIDAGALSDPSYVVEHRFAAHIAEKHVQAMVEEARTDTTADVPARAVAVEDNPVHALIRAGSGADLLVVGSRGRGGFTGLLLGSVSQGVLHHADVPVVLVRNRAQGETADAG